MEHLQNKMMSVSGTIFHQSAKMKSEFCLSGWRAQGPNPGTGGSDSGDHTKPDILLFDKKDHGCRFRHITALYLTAHTDSTK